MEGPTIVYSFGYSPGELFAKIGVSSHTREPYGIATAETVGVEQDGVSGVEWK